MCVGSNVAYILSAMLPTMLIPFLRSLLLCLKSLSLLREEYIETKWGLKKILTILKGQILKIQRWGVINYP